MIVSTGGRASCQAFNELMQAAQLASCLPFAKRGALTARFPPNDFPGAGAKGLDVAWPGYSPQGVRNGLKRGALQALARD